MCYRKGSGSLELEPFLLMCGYERKAMYYVYWFGKT